MKDKTINIVTVMQTPTAKRSSQVDEELPIPETTVINQLPTPMMCQPVHFSFRFLSWTVVTTNRQEKLFCQLNVGNTSIHVFTFITWLPQLKRL